MGVELQEQGPILSDADVERLEKALRHRLPDKYRQFMMQQNGGAPVQPTYFEHDPDRLLHARVSSV